MTTDAIAPVQTLVTALQHITEALEALAPAEAHRQATFAMKTRGIRLARTELMGWLDEPR